MQRDVVVDQIDAEVIGITPADVRVERQHLGCGLDEPVATKQDVRVHIVAAEEVANRLCRVYVARRRQGRSRCA